MRKKEKDICHSRRDAEEYNRRIDEEEKARINAGKRRRGKRKKYKDIPVWDPITEMQDIVSRMVYGKHKHFREYSSIVLSQEENGTYKLEWTEDFELRGSRWS